MSEETKDAVQSGQVAGENPAGQSAPEAVDTTDGFKFTGTEFQSKFDKAVSETRRLEVENQKLQERLSMADNLEEVEKRLSQADSLRSLADAKEARIKIVAEKYPNLLTNLDLIPLGTTEEMARAAKKLSELGGGILKDSEKKPEAEPLGAVPGETGPSEGTPDAETFAKMPREQREGLLKKLGLFQ